MSDITMKFIPSCLALLSLFQFSYCNGTSDDLAENILQSLNLSRRQKEDIIEEKEKKKKRILKSIGISWNEESISAVVGRGWVTGTNEKWMSMKEKEMTLRLRRRQREGKKKKRKKNQQV